MPFSIRLSVKLYVQYKNDACIGSHTLMQAGVFVFLPQYKPASHNKGKLEFEHVRLKQELNHTLGNEMVSHITTIIMM